MIENKLRVKEYERFHRDFTQISDVELSHLINSVNDIRSSPWGQTLTIQFGGSNFFIKLIPLTELEQSAPYSTSNLFDLPLFYHYGVGSAGFGAWREYKAHQITTSWAITGECHNFPIMYHGRILSGQLLPQKQHVRELEKDVAYWDHCPSVRNRLMAIDQSEDWLVIILEHFPQTLRSWICKNLEESMIDSAVFIDDIYSKLTDVADFMRRQEFIHFDAHFDNLLTDGENIIFSDFGLSLSTEYNLSRDEIDFLNKHLEMYDQSCCVVNLLHAILSVYGDHSQVRISLTELMEKAKGNIPVAVQPFIQKHLPLGLVMDNFFGKLINESKSTPFPTSDCLRRSASGSF